MNEEMKLRFWICRGEKTETNSRFIEENLLPTRLGFTDLVAIETDSELKLPVFLKRVGVNPLSLVRVTSLSETENEEFPSFQA